MEVANKPDFLRRLLGLAEIYAKTLSKDAIELYWNALNDLSFDEFSRAANVLARTARFFPKPAEFRSLVLPDPALEAALAYGKVEQAFHEAGIYKSVIFDDPTIHAAIEHLGGWQEYCNTPDEKLVFYRRDFEKYYALFNERVKSGQLTPIPVLLGLYALDDHASKKAKAPVLIGDKGKIKALESGESVRTGDISIKGVLDNYRGSSV